MINTRFVKAIIILLTLQTIIVSQSCSQKTVEMANTLRYTDLHKNGELKKRGEELWKRMEICDLCPRECEADRLAGERGDCRANSTLEIASYGPHFGEEPELVGKYGSGTIFFTNCAMRCVFCINHDISHGGYGVRHSIKGLASIMLDLQKAGRHNINLVSPSHYIPHILLALDIAAGKGLNIPLVYNTHGWEKPEILAYLDGVVDIYLSDFKYGCSEQAGKYSVGAFSYVELSKEAHLEMQRQVGTAKADTGTGLMSRGLMIRHLVMPNDVSCTNEVMEWIAENLPKDTYINMMSQYTPVFKAPDYPEISRSITVKEYRMAINAATSAGLSNVRVQGYR